MPSQAIQAPLNLVAKEAIADAEAAFLKSFLKGLDEEKTLGEVLQDLLDNHDDIFDYDSIGQIETQAIKGLLSVKISQIKLESRKKTKNGVNKRGKKKSRRGKKPKPPTNKPDDKADTQEEK